METEQKMAAAIAAVMAYLKSEEEMAAASAAAAQAAAQPPPAATAVSTGMWGLSGRQAMMQTRSMMQMKSFHGVRCR